MECRGNNGKYGISKRSVKGRIGNMGYVKGVQKKDSEMWDE